jgi:predicted DNA-binding transcriptional regulator AlpA
MPETSKRPARATVPETGFMRKSQVLQVVPFSATTLWRRVKDGSFPAPVPLSDRVVAFRAEDIRQWIEARGLRA